MGTDGRTGPERRSEDARVRRRRSQVAYGRRRRTRIKAELVAERGARCSDCGYARSIEALGFHHLDPSAKEFSLSGFQGTLDRARREAAKCVLVCENCHRVRHRVAPGRGASPVSEFRRRSKRRAVETMGGACGRCGFHESIEALEFHHLDPASKEFGIGTDGIPRSWRRVQAELAKCVLLCANCHRETHADLRGRGMSNDESRYT